MIAVIGGGPVGSIAALEAVKKDDVTIFEEHYADTQPVRCAGLISKSGLNRIGVAGRDFVQNKVRGAKIYSPSGNLLEVDAGETKAFVVDRRAFDEHLLNTARDAGCGVVNERVRDINFKDMKKVILATGANYQLHRKLDLPAPKFLSGAQYEMKISCDPDFVELYLGETPDFFAWVIPLDDNLARIGSASRRNPTPYLENFIKKLKGRMHGDEILNKTYGKIPIYSPKIKTSHANGKIIMVGDAAAQVKATTGGGVVMGGIAAKFSCRTDYEKKWRCEIGRELWLHLQIRRFLNKISDRALDELISLLNEHKDIIERKGDMDIASELLVTGRAF
ncbi:MAG: hypothetical protein A7315_15330 [Candidatus Altiarchaeales archaeon WOR_SM1_79]|nr:MAG: hypothetical protein A7315_15330 [Candidatus Altiarchaeales archaeon WOR_SM1_79]